MDKIIDTHTHLFDEAFDNDRGQVVARAIDSGVFKMMCPAIDSSSHDRLFALCDSYPQACLPMMGLHPTSVNDNPDWRKELELVANYLNDSQRRFYAVGEVGLDLYWSREWFEQQKEAFTNQLELAINHDLPLVIHTRDAWAEMGEILIKYKGRGVRGIMHAFSGTEADYRALRGCGDFLFGIGGPVTYKKSALHEVVTIMSLSEMVLETDSPYLPPAPFRGKRNESSYVAYVAEKVAEIKNISVSEVVAATTANAQRMFRIEN